MLRAAGDLDRVADTLNSMASLAIGDGDIERAQELYEEALRTKEEAGASASAMLVNLGWLALESGDLAAAADRFELVGASAETGEDVGLAAWSRLGLGVIAWIDGDLDRAEAWFDQATDTWSELEARPNLVYGHVGQALVLRQRGEVSLAAQRSISALESAVDLGGGERNAFALGIVVSVLVAAGRYPEAVRLMAALLALAEHHGWAIWSWYRAHLDACIDRARGRVGKEESAALESGGSEMTIDDALHYALIEARRLASGGGAPRSDS
jgi:tetratricopeptide (TPR) repeat protein